MLSLARGLERCSRPDEANDVLVKAAALDPRNAAVPVRQARLFALRPDYVKAEEALARAEVLFRERTNYEGVCEVLVTRGTYQAAGEDLKSAAETLTKAREMAVSLSDVRQQVRVGLQMAIVSRKRGDVAAAERLTTEAVDLARRHSLEPLTLEGLLGNGNVHLVRNQFPQALALFEQARAIAETNRHEQYLARSNLTLASVYVRAMEPDKAERSLSAARPYFERAGQTRNLAAVDILQGEVLGIQAAYPAALAQFTSALAAAERAKDRDQEIRTRENIATTLASMGRYPEALAEYERVLAVHRSVGRARSETFTLLNISDTLSRMGRFSEASAAMQKAEAAIPREAAEIQATMLLVRSGNAYRQGRYPAALSDAQRSIVVGSGLSSERTARAHLVACAASARLARSADAQRHCSAARDVEGLDRHKRLWLEVQLAEAEVKVMLGNLAGAAEQAMAALPDLETSETSTDRWRSLAVLAAAATSAAHAEARNRLKRELAALQALWGPTLYESWSQRTDVRSLLATAGA
jgi:tetratricopeptide (TPR) repeat protein